jgi:hypothetical protein
MFVGTFLAMVLDTLLAMVGATFMALYIAI